MAAKAFYAMMLDAATIITIVLLKLTIMFDAYLVVLLALKDVIMDRPTFAFLCWKGRKISTLPFFNKKIV